MPRAVQRVTDMDIDEVSMVDRAANTAATIVFSKRADQEEFMPDYSDEDGNELDLSQFEEGTILEDDNGDLYEVSFDDDDDDDEEFFEGDYADEGEYASIGKSAFGAGPNDEAIASIRYDLSKALSEDDRDQVLSKAFSTLSKRAAYAEDRLAYAEDVAASERDLRLEREYISKAAEYNVPIDAEDLGPVLMRAAQALSYDDCAVIHKALCAAGEMLYVEAGFDGIGAADDPMSQIDAFLDERVSKSNGSTHAGAMTAFFDDNPEAYDALRSDRF